MIDRESLGWLETMIDSYRNIAGAVEALDAASCDADAQEAYDAIRDEVATDPAATWEMIGQVQRLHDELLAQLPAEGPPELPPPPSSGPDPEIPF